ncbi:MAG: BCCT family transporter [Bacteroidota bacterium]
MSRLRLWVFLPPFLILLFSCIYSLIDQNAFLAQATAINDWILDHFSWLYASTTFLLVLLCIVVYFSPLAKVKIGGEQAQPILSRWRWFSITLTTTVAIGILFWGTAEPLFHLHQPPDGLGIDPNSPAAATFSMSTMFMHWTFTPYAIYTIAGLTFAIGYYNLKQPFSLGAMLYPLLGKRANGRLAKIIDAICLFSLAAGMAASLGAGILTIGGGIEDLFAIENGKVSMGLVTVGIVLCFLISAASGLLKGIRILADINIRAFILLAIFVFLFGPISEQLAVGWSGLKDYVVNFVPRSLPFVGIEDRDWAHSWTMFYWANWLAWTPITAIFLGRLSYGYTVRDYIHFNWILPAIFGGVWMMIFSGTTLHFDQIESSALYATLQESGVERIIYAVFDRLPASEVMGIIFLLITFLSYITAADSNTSAMSGISSTGISPKSPEPSFGIKLVWGVTIGAIAWIMVSFAGIDGVKMTSNLGGFPALFLVIAVAIGLVKLIVKGKAALEEETME